MPKNKKNTNSRRVVGATLAIPRRLLAPIGSFLAEQIKKLELRRSSIANEDPFVAGRSENSASPDTGAAEQFGHARIEAIRAEIDRKAVQLRKALSRVKIGKYGICENCGLMIDTDRLVVYPETTLCVRCEREAERKR